MNMKKLAAEAAVELVQDGMVVGLGTGSTAYWAIQKLGHRVKAGLRINAIATSSSSEELARQLEIPIVSFADIDHIDLTIDGADEADSKLTLVKGGGGALLREKIVAAASRIFYVVADESKLVSQLGAFPLPVEVIPFGADMTKRQIEKLGCGATIRMQAGKCYITDNGNYILDCEFGAIHDPERLHVQLNAIPGVVENGLFINMAHSVFVGYQDGSVRRMEL
ncbi:ribose-5-phosphate isomerase RpiA [Paenibacillus profundus]|uniref:Ribose-5-phosphate isomerase A n=1 Tax=Paenibacillus profundus TaxID=1173085 RepID=A0ABS8YKG3_9BACL|nr:ribose-5-phosphate isomerase RpiA [Paenibacillus profundus]MCE5170826.1 ribose-5-phosphate isomerase RpiA [Paenibacillus profundus]